VEELTSAKKVGQTLDIELGTRLDNSTFRIATALRLGAPICAHHQYASALKTSSNMVFMVCHAGGLPVVIRETAPSITLLSNQPTKPVA